VVVTPITTMKVDKERTHILFSVYRRSVATVHEVLPTWIRGGEAVGGM
jgi:hypothetical protein